MNSRANLRGCLWGVLIACCTLLAPQAFAQQTINGQVLGGGAPIANSTVTLWQARAAAPKQLAQAKTNTDGRFEIRNPAQAGDTSLYLVATGGVPKSGGGDNPAIALLTVLGSKPRQRSRSTR